MRIVVIRHSIRNRGGDRLVLDYCSYLVQKGHGIVYWTNEVNTHFPIDPRIQIKQIPYPQKRGTIRFALSTKFDADIVLVDLVAMSVFASIPNGKKIVYLAQDDDRTYYSSPLLRFMMEIIYRIAFWLFRVRAIAVSDYLKEKLERLAKGRVKSVSNGIDHRIFYHEDKSRYATEKKASIAIVLFARSDFHKGLDVGIKAVEELARLRGVKDWELWVIGDENANINVEGLKIKKWGLLKSEALRGVLSAADIYLSPSRHEGFGLMQLEAMACGCVMITTKAFSLVENELNGLVCPIEDWQSLARALNRVLSDSGLFERLRQNGLKLAKNYSIDKSRVQFEKTLLEFVQK
ncbi:MAG TPA: hypothetical protein DD723_01930 [Candidatus Omnitrophica bacterium]|nr:MAG: hypothetical protein A2Z81_08965 [Omnitrophica WOR_2 bacterium GWA2_45_18]OGX20876.1 MAG: hypothetical protein A2Y04_02390 [Omnitrophica WOR_2 bacterium GWC2_45_7]HBR14286.1 hypothetical protein [Candidatus Omnitrophota bacterium]